MTKHHARPPSGKGHHRAKSMSASLGVFDPSPSGRFAARALAESGVEGALIGRLAVWAWLSDPSDHAYTKISTSRLHAPISSGFMLGWRVTV